MNRRVALLVTATLAGCSGTGPSVRLGSDIAPGIQVTKGRAISAQACNYWWWPFATGMDRLTLANDRLNRVANGDLIVDVVIRQYRHDVGAGAVHCTELTARAATAAGVRPPAAIAPADGAPVAAVAPGTRVELKVVMTNAAGKWWYVTAADGAGWILESDLEPLGP